MFKCHDCDTVFDEPKLSGQHHPYGEGYAFESYSVCPRCGGSFSEAFACKGCGEYSCSEELHNSYCIDCLKDKGLNSGSLIKAVHGLLSPDPHTKNHSPLCIFTVSVK